MQNINELKGKTSAEVKEILSQSWEHVWAQVAEDDFESFLAVILPLKVITPEIFKLAASSNLASQVFLNSCLEFDFNPGINYLDQVLAVMQNEDLLVRTFNHFSSLPVSVPLLMQIINFKLITLAGALMASRVDLQRPSIIRQVLRLGADSEALVDVLFIKNTELELFKKDLETSPEKYSVSVLDYVIANYINNLPSFNFSKWSKLANEFNELVTLSCLIRYTTGLSGGYYSEKWTMDYRPVFEEIELNYFLYNKVLEVKGIPKNSQLRLWFVERKPLEAEDEELFAYLKNPRSLDRISGVINSLLAGSLEITKQIDISLIVSHITPAKLASAIQREEAAEEKAIYFMEKLPSKYASFLKPLISEEKLVSKGPSKKTSYFSEILDAVRTKDIEEIRKITSTTKYTLEKFSEDSSQSSKKEATVNVRLSSELVEQLTKEELTTLVASKLSSGVWESLNLKYTLTAQEAYDLGEKLGYVNLFMSCSDKIGLIKKLEKDDLEVVFSNHLELLAAEPLIFAEMLNKFKSIKQMDLGPDAVRTLATQVSAEDIRNFVKFDTSTLKQLINQKDFEGTFIVDKPLITKLVQDNAMEDIEFMEGLISRDPEFSKDLLSAYLKGNKELSALLGEPISIRRTQKEKIEKYLNLITTSPAQVIDSVFNASANLEEFEKIVNWEAHLKEFHSGRIVQVNYSHLDKLAELTKNFPKLKFHIKTLNLFTEGWNSKVSYKALPDLISMDSIVIKDVNEKVVEFIKALRQRNPDLELKYLSNEFDTKLQLFSFGVNFEGQVDFISDICKYPENYISKLSIPDLNILEAKANFYLNTKAVQSILLGYLEPKKVAWVLERDFPTEGLFFISDPERYCQKNLGPKFLAKIKDKGIKVFEKEEYEFNEVTQQLISQGVDFEPLSVNNLSTERVASIIKFIETKVDPRYAKLGMLGKSLAGIKFIYPYEQMIQSDTLSEEFLINFLNIPKTISSNKKIMAGVVALFAEDEGFLSGKVRTVKLLLSTINPSIEIEFSDLINYQNPASIEVSDFIKETPTGLIAEFITQYQANPSAASLFKDKNKTSIFRFVRTGKGLGGNYLRDILQMLQQVYEGLDKFDQDLKSGNFNEVQMREISSTVSNINSKLAELLPMDHAVHLHGRVQTLASYIKSDPLEQLGQDYLKDMHKDNSFDYPLFFPKSRGELSELGELHDWCVGNHRSYGTGVMRDGNILVAICEKGSEPSIQSAIALAHYQREDDGLSLEQCRWSTQKSGQNNVDAKSDFPMAELNRLLTQYLSLKIKEDKKKAKQKQ